MSPRTRAKRPHGQMRQSQLITTFGPGAMMDLPNYSVLIAGLDHWFPTGEEIVEPRLTEKLCRLLEVPSLQLRIPPPDQEEPTAPPTGITAWQFPEWFITQDVNIVRNPLGVRSRLLVHRPGTLSREVYRPSSEAPFGRSCAFRACLSCRTHW